MTKDCPESKRYSHFQTGRQERDRSQHTPIHGAKHVEKRYLSHPSP